jgi:hypothetical protein
VAGLEEPVLAYLTCCQILGAGDDARADALLAAGHAFLQERATQFVDEARRSRFLNNLPAHRELLAAWHAYGGADDAAPEHHAPRVGLSSHIGHAARRPGSH